MEEDLVDRLYEGAVMPKHWPGILDTLSDLTNGGGRSLHIFGKDAAMPMVLAAGFLSGLPFPLSNRT